VSPDTGTFGGDDNKVHLISRSEAEPMAGPNIEEWPEFSKVEVAARLAERIAQSLGSAA